MKKQIEEILDICLDKIDKGVSVDELLSQYPDYKDELKELLVIAKNIKDSSLIHESDKGLYFCLIKVGKEIQLQKEIAHKPRFLYFQFPVWAKALVFTLIITLISIGTINLSARSIPGDFLYPIKLITEKVKFLLTINSEDKVELRIIYSEERTRELVKYLDEKGTLNTDIIKAMLDEATFALENISRLPEDEKKIYYLKLEHLNAYQKNILEDIKPKVTLPQKEKLDDAIEMCGRRMNWMHKMCGNHMEWMDKMKKDEISEDKMQKEKWGCWNDWR